MTANTREHVKMVDDIFDHLAVFHHVLQLFTCTQFLTTGFAAFT